MNQAGVHEWDPEETSQPPINPFNEKKLKLTRNPQLSHELTPNLPSCLFPIPLSLSLEKPFSL